MDDEVACMFVVLTWLRKKVVELPVTMEIIRMMNMILQLPLLPRLPHHEDELVIVVVVVVVAVVVAVVVVAEVLKVLVAKKVEMVLLPGLAYIGGEMRTFT